MAFANSSESSARAHHDDDHEQIPSNASTPPGGAATPHPDLSDKRLPGISSNYFGQVGEPFDSAPTSTSSTSDLPRRASSRDDSASGSEAPTPNSLSDADDPSPMLPHERSEILAKKETRTQPHSYPTPPVSSSSAARKQQQKSGAELDGVDRDRFASGQRSPRRKLSTLDSLPLKMRRFTPSSHPMSNIVTAPTVQTSHISSPGHIISPTTPSTPLRRLSRARDTAQSSSANERLTQDMSRLQSTPPGTPRTSSHASGPSRTHSPSATPKRLAQARKRSSALTGEHRGKLTVYISEGRGVKPSEKPYIVCQFQWNEFISKGPQKENRAKDSQEIGKETPRAGTPIKRGESDMGRPMAIPMRSRQSSHTSFRDQAQDTKIVTDPIWNHEAVL